MNYQQAKETLDLLGQASRSQANQRYQNLERHLDASDRVVAQAAQLALINDSQSLPDLPREVIEEADPT